MNNLKDDILSVSLSLFNKHGIDGVKTRDIAEKAGISLGNLTYYYPTKNDIVLALCRQFIDRVDEELVDEPAPNGLLYMYHLVKRVFLIQLEYRFILNARYAEIVASLPEVQRHYRNVLVTRLGYARQLYTQMVSEGLAEKALIANTVELVYMVNIIGLFWQQELAIYSPEMVDEEKVEYALAVLFQAYRPYLTAKGKKVLMPLLKKMEAYKIS